jgi:hypothetical protein
VLLEKIISKDKKLLLEIKSGVKGSLIELFLGGFANCLAFDLYTYG